MTLSKAPQRRISVSMRAGLVLALALAVAGAAPAYPLSGSLRDSDGNPVEGAEVWVAEEYQVQRTRSNGDGDFSFPDVAPGPVSVVAWKEGLAFTGREVQVLGPTTVPLVLGRAVPLRLRVLDRDLRPVAGAAVRYLYISDRFLVPAYQLRDHGFPPLRSGEDGVMTLGAMPEKGHFALVVYHPRYTETRVPYLPLNGETQTIQLYPGTAIRGRVTSPAGQAVAGARVLAYRETSAGTQSVAECFTDQDGYYHFTVRPGEYHVAARHPEFATPPAHTVAVAVADDELGVNIKMNEARDLTGTVLGPGDAPLSGVMLRYIVGGFPYLDRLSRHDGSFHLSIPAGRGALRVIPPPGWVPDHDGDILVTLDTAEKAELDPIRLLPLPAVRGTVRDAAGQPQPKVLIGTRNVAPPLWVLTDDQGRFDIRLYQAPEEGRAQFRAEHGLRFLRRDFEVDLRQDQPLELVLEEFEPDLSKPEPDSMGNDLHDLIDGRAPRLEVDHWFNSPPLSLEQLLGKVVVLTFWGGFDDIGAGPDRMNELRALHALLDGVDDVVIVGIHDNGSEPAEIEQFIEAYRIPFPVARDVEAFTTFSRYRIKYIPQTVLIDKKGVLRHYRVDGRLLELVKSLRREG